MGFSYREVTGDLDKSVSWHGEGKRLLGVGSRENGREELSG